MEDNLKQEHRKNCKRIVLFGPECTGKTTLAKQLARHYNTVYVPEYARLYAEEHGPLSIKDVLPIAKGQIQLENKKLVTANKVLICDTNLLETKVYASLYYPDFNSPLLDQYALKNKYDLYLLTGIDVPWQRDNIRDAERYRESHFEAFKSELTTSKLPYVLIQGSPKERLLKAIIEINKLLLN